MEEGTGVVCWVSGEPAIFIYTRELRKGYYMTQWANMAIFIVMMAYSQHLLSQKSQHDNTKHDSDKAVHIAWEDKR